ncbi:MAG: single-stranded-DNA-specific exonuclease RecJ [Spirochaetota bacterium]
MKENWHFVQIDNHAADRLRAELDIDEFIAHLLCARGIVNADDAMDFLNPRLSNLHSPYLLRDMELAVARIRQVVDNSELVGIYSDSDLDGLTSLSLMVTLFDRLQVKSIYRYPVDDEKYGLSMDVVEHFAAQNISLLITLDSGIRDIDEIEYARSLGIDVIVCDHHQPDNVIPDAIVVNPCRNDCTYPFSDLAGVGVTFKLCQAVVLSYSSNYNIPHVLLCEDNKRLTAAVVVRGVTEKEWLGIDIDELLKHLEERFEKTRFFYFDIEETIVEKIKNKFKENEIFDIKNLQPLITSRNKNLHVDKMLSTGTDGIPLRGSKIKRIEQFVKEIQLINSEKITAYIKESLPLVALGTIADLMPLNDENRILVKQGLWNFDSLSHGGMKMLVKDINKMVSSKVIGWDIAPLLNTPGRFGKTKLTADFLISRDDAAIQDNLRTIKQLNEYRKEVIHDLFSNLIHEIEKGSINSKGKIVYVESEKCPEGLTGLLANRIADHLHKPVIVVSINHDTGIVKGSGRTSGNFDFFSIVEPFRNCFLKIGGHAQAFGFSGEKETIRRIMSDIESSVPVDLTPKELWQIDCEIPIKEVNFKTIDKLAAFEPFGVQNQPFVFLSRNCVVNDVKIIGKNRKHIKCHFKNATSIDAVGWNMAELIDMSTISNSLVDILYNIEINEYNGSVSPQIVLREMHVLESEVCKKH